VPDFRRNYVPGGTYFFTCVTHCRAPILTANLGRACLRDAIERTRRDHFFKIDWGGADPTPGWDDPEWGEGR
jgi:putative transposase